MAQEAQEEARRLALLDRAVFFLPGWVPFEQRQDYLLEADLGVSAHPATVETRFAFRTRVLDYLWAGLPMVLTSGDYFSELAERAGLGLSVPPGDVEAWVRAILHLTGNTELRRQIKARLADVASQFTWNQAAQPLLKYCNNPYRAPRMPKTRAAISTLSTPIFEWWMSRKQYFQ
jgi:hypothetical protein